MAEVIGGMTGALQGTLSGVINQGQTFLDRIFPPEKRNELWAKLSKFATEKPMLAVGALPFQLSTAICFALERGANMNHYELTSLGILVLHLLANRS